MVYQSRLFLGLVALFWAIVLVYLPAIGYEFVQWDDYAFVVKNVHIRPLSVSSLFRLLTSMYQGAWMPLTWLSHAVDLKLWGLNPGPHHLMSILFHGVNCVLFALLATRLQQAAGLSGQRVYVAAFAAALIFGIHPLRVESVVWISARKDVLSGCFYLLTVISYLDYAQAECRKSAVVHMGAALVFCACAQMSKASAMSLPLVLLILDFYPLQRMNRLVLHIRLMEKIPFILLAAAGALLNHHAASSAAIPFWYVPLWVRVMNASYAIFFYIFQTIFPSGLVPLYQLDPHAEYFAPSYVTAAVWLVGITMASVLAAVQGKRLFPAIWWYYLITLAPMLGLHMSYRHAAADRYTYIPTLCWYLLMGVGIGIVWKRVSTSSFRTFAQILLVVALAGCVAVYGFKTHNQMRIWKNTENLWRHTIETAVYIPALAYFGLGRVMQDKGNFEEATTLYRRAYELNPRNVVYVLKLGAVLGKLGEWTAALDAFLKAAELAPREPIVYLKQGQAYAGLDQWSQAGQAFDRALHLTEKPADILPAIVGLCLKRGQVGWARDYVDRYDARGYEVPAYLRKLLEEAENQ